MNLSDSKKKLALGGAVCGIVAAILALLGNPANMAFCIACFIRDTAGAFGMHQAEAVQYARPEIIGLVLGAFIISVATKEFCATAGSSPMIRFVLGVIIMIGAGIPWMSVTYGNSYVCRRSECMGGINRFYFRCCDRGICPETGIQSGKSACYK